MNAIPYESREEDWDRYDDEMDEALPGRPRRNYLNKWSALLFALILGGAGFYGGIRVEKGQLASSGSTGTGFASALASRFGAAATGTAGSGSSTTAGGSTGASGAAGTTGASGAAGTSGASGFAGRFGGGFGGFAGLAGSSTVGTISSISGNTIYVAETSGNTVKVKLSSVTKFTKTVTVTKAKIYPGDSVVIAGPAGKNGTVTATSLTDSGTRSSASGSTSSSSSTSGSSAVSSLF